MRYDRPKFSVVLFNTLNLTVSAPFEVSRPELQKIKRFCYDSEYSYALEDDYRMSQDELDTFMKSMEEWEDS